MHIEPQICSYNFSEYKYMVQVTMRVDSFFNKSLSVKPVMHVEKLHGSISEYLFRLHIANCKSFGGRNNLRIGL